MWQSVLVYVDDILVFSKTFDDHIKDLERVFERLSAFGMHLKPEKCFFCRPEEKTAASSCCT